jgi:hypothetical protein
MPGSKAIALPRPLEFGLRLALAYGLLVWLAFSYGHDLVEALVPIFRTFVIALDDQGRVLSLATAHDGADTVLRLQARLTKPILVGTRWFAADGSNALQSTMTIGAVLQPGLVALGLACAWPAQRVLEFLLRLALVGAAIALLLLADAPLSLWCMYLNTNDPGHPSSLTVWETFLLDGGRPALGLAAAVIAIGTARRLVVNQPQSA